MSAAAATLAPNGIGLRHLFELRAQVGAPITAHAAAWGTRRVIPVLGGRFEGDRLSGSIEPGGADHQLIRPDGVAELDVRLALTTDDGAKLYMSVQGLRAASPEVTARIAAGEDVDPALYYFREALRFETSSAAHAWLNQRLFLATGERRPTHVGLSVYEVL